ncbi:MAG: polysaccharide deacetylase family protein [Deltaproteobacteria bacterium]|nr:polysaccharide deacetylase family protein [Deltaproteobacteria bacterium]
MGFLKSSVLSLAGRVDRLGGGVPILLYHSLDDDGSAVSVRPRFFRAHMEYLARAGWRVLGIGDLLREWSGAGAPPRKTVAVTLDDGLVSQHRVAFPVLRDLGFGATVFVPTAKLGTSADWNLPDSFPDFPLMSWDDAAEMVAGGIEVEPHGRHHRSLTALDAGALADEVGGAAADLESRLGRKPQVFSYPYGHEDERVRAAVRSAGIPSAVAVADAVYRPGDDLYRVPRLSMDSTRAADDAEAVLILRTALAGTLADLLRTKRAILGALGRRKLVASQQAHADRR